MIDWWCPVIQRQNTVGTNVGYQEQKAINTIYPVFADDTKIYSIIKSVRDIVKLQCKEWSRL